MADTIEVAREAAEQALNAVGRISLESARMRNDVEQGQKDGMHIWKIGSDIEGFAVAAAREIYSVSAHIELLAIEHKKAWDAREAQHVAALRAAQESDLHPKHNSAIRKQVWDLTGGKCAYCETDLAPEGNGSLSFVVEHVVPTSQGGPDNLANYVPACMSCNTSKGADHVLLFIQRRFPNRARPAQPYVTERLE